MTKIAVVVNPTRVRRPGRFRAVIDEALAARGFPAAHYLLTTAEDPGAGQARAALDGGADRVLVAGGDGTVRMVLGALQGGTVAVGLLPAGTGNLLARNIRLPLGLRRAVEVALDGNPQPLDLIRYQVLETDERGYAVAMAGLGADAAVVADTDDRLKRFGALGYAMAGLHHIKSRPANARVAVDSDVLVREASLVTVGNVGELRRGLRLFPRSRPADGQLDVLVASPRHVGHVLTMAAGVLVSAPRIPLIDRRVGRDIVIHCGEPVPCQVDGDYIGAVRAIRFEVLPGAVTVVRRPNPM